MLLVQLVDLTLYSEKVTREPCTTKACEVKACEVKACEVKENDLQKDNDQLIDILKLPYKTEHIFQISLQQL